MFTNPANIKQFIINTLHCDCPDDVFDYIEWTKGMNISESNKPPLLIDFLFNIGHKLLVFVLIVPNDIRPSDFESLLPRLVNLGRTKRDKENFNRFRLVIMTESVTEFREKLTPIFTYLVGIDQKMHLHILEHA